MFDKCPRASTKNGRGTLKNHNFITYIKKAIAEITFAEALTIFAILVIFISISFFIVLPMNNFSDVQEFKFLDFYTALILGGWQVYIASIYSLPTDGVIDKLSQIVHRTYMGLFDIHPLATLQSATSGISNPTPYCNTNYSRVVL